MLGAQTKGLAIKREPSMNYRPTSRRKSLRGPHILRQHETSDVRNKFEPFAIHHRLNVLQNRQHQAFLRNISVDRFVTGDALSFILLAPQRTDLLIDVFGFPTRVR